MKSHLFIGEFAALTGVTVKTVLHYHKVGLLDEPQRSSGGYRLYGAEELYRMVSIKQLKSLGLSLEQIKSMMSKQTNPISMRSVLQSLQIELSAQIRVLEERLERVQTLLNNEPLDLEKGREDPPTFKMIADILGTEAYKDLPELLEQERSIYRLLDDYNWGLDHKKTYGQVAEYFQANPEEYKLMIDYNQRIMALSDFPEDATESEMVQLAKDCVRIIADIPIINELYKNQGNQVSFEPIINEMLCDLLSPAQIRFCELVVQYWEEAAQQDEAQDSSQ